jgi:hypothetical protein
LFIHVYPLSHSSKFTSCPTSPSESIAQLPKRSSSQS